MNTFIEELDDILRVMSMELTVPATITGKVPENLYAIEEKASKEIMNLVSERIIGDKEYYHEHYPFVRTQKQHIEAKEKSARDELRVDQRTTLYEGTKEKIDVLHPPIKSNGDNNE